MDGPSLKQVESLWPDVAEPFDEVVPAGCRLTLASDEWRSGGDARRVRRIELTPEPDAPSLGELLEEAREDAFREGWTPLEDGTYELEDVILTLEAASERLAVEFSQPWPPDAGPPVETSDMFQNLVRELLGLAADPQRLAKIVLVHEVEQMVAAMLVEEVEMPSPENLIRAFDELGFEPPGQEGGDWVSTETTDSHEITAHVKKTKNWCRVRMQKRRLG